MFWKYWAAMATSRMGDGISAVALPLVALTQLDASNLEVGLIAAATCAATVLIGLPAGVVVDRFALRGLQVGMDAFRAVAVLTIPVAVWCDALTLPHLLLAVFLIGLASNLFDVANATFLPAVVRKEELTARNGLLSGTDATTQIAGPGLGGLLVHGVGAASGLVVDAVTFLASAALLGRIPAAGRPARAAPRTGMARQVAVGLRYVFRHPVMRPSVIAATAVNLAGGAVLTLTPLYVVRTLHLPANAVGLVLAAEGVGSVLAAAVTARLVARFGSARVLLCATAAGPVLGLAMPLAATQYAGAIFGFGAAGLAAGVTVLSVISRTHRQTVSPPALLSRVMASVRFVSWAAIPVGALGAGVAAELWSPRAGLVAASAATFLAPVAVGASRIRVLRELTDAEPAPPAAPALPGPPRTPWSSPPAGPATSPAAGAPAPGLPGTARAGPSSSACHR